MTEEQRRKNRETQKKVWANPKLRKRHSEIHKGQIPWCAGKKLSKEHKINLSLSHKGKPAWNKGIRTGRPSWMKGRHHTPEAVEKNKLAHLGKIAWNKGKKTGLIPWNKGKIGTLHHTEEARLKIKQARAKQIFPLSDSLSEIKVQNFLKQLNIEFIPHKYMNIKHSYLCDIFVPSANLVIEVDGDYWHGNINNPRFKVLNKSQIKTKEKDNIRTKELQEKGFNVLRLWESEIGKMNLQDFIQKIKPFERK